MKLDLYNLKLGIVTNLRNSQELYDEAEILFKYEKYARTFLLSHIAIEECSKCAMLLKMIAFKIWEEEIDMRTVRRRYSNHREKIKNFEILKVFLNKKDLKSINIYKLIETINDSKNNSLYVNWTAENEFILPNEIFKKKDAEEKLNEALNYLKLYTSISIKLIENELEVYNILKNSKLKNIIT